MQGGRGWHGMGFGGVGGWWEDNSPRQHSVACDDDRIFIELVKDLKCLVLSSAHARGLTRREAHVYSTKTKAKRQMDT